MPRERRIIWSGESSECVWAVVEYLKAEWGDKEANNFLVKLKKFERRVKRFPYLYPASIKHQELRKAVITRHRSVIYEVYDDEVRVCRDIPGKNGRSLCRNVLREFAKF